jgi:acetate kinase
MRRLREAASSNPDARLAIRMFCYSVRKEVAAMIAALDGADLLFFAGGIGEHDAEAPAAICGGPSWIGISLDEARNRSAKNPSTMPHRAAPYAFFLPRKTSRSPAIPGN